MRILDESELRDAFAQLDTDKDGVLSPAELVVAASRLGVPGAKATESMSYDAFRRLVEERETALRLAFDELDENGNGELSPAELRRGLVQQAPGLASALSKDDVDALFARLDRDGNGAISYTEWVASLILMPPLARRAALREFALASMIDSAEYGDARRAQVPATTPATEDKEGVLRTLVAGGFSGAVSRSATAPIDRLKVLLQVGTAGTLMGGMQTIYRDGGTRGFWRGNGVNVVKVVPEMAAKFASFEFFKGVFVKDPDHPQPLERFFAGSAAGVVSQTLIFPLETIKTRVTAATSPLSLQACVRGVWREGGVRNFFSGLQPAVLGVVPFSGVDLMLYSILRDKAAERNGVASSDLHVGYTLACGSASSSVAQMVSYPLAVVRTRLQATSEFSSMSACTRAVWAEGGLRAMYRGIVPSLAKGLPSSIIGYLCFEEAKKLLAGFNV